eukprot:6198389-Pleurochrysis_carterae.AAC.4
MSTRRAASRSPGVGQLIAQPAEHSFLHGCVRDVQSCVSGAIKEAALQPRTYTICKGRLDEGGKVAHGRCLVRMEAGWHPGREQVGDRALVVDVPALQERRVEGVVEGAVAIVGVEGEQAVDVAAEDQALDDAVHRAFESKDAQIRFALCEAVLL